MVDVDRVRTGPEVPGVPVPRTVAVDRFAVCDQTLADTVEDILQGARATAGSRPYVAFALHVGGLNVRTDPAYRAAMDEADLVYADGISVVLLARLAGARELERAGTTDLGWDVLRGLSRRLGRPARVALVGGPDGLTARAGQVLTEQAGVQVVAAEHGYHQDWSGVLARLRASGCDVLVVGMGAPREMTWVHRHLADLPPALVLTCGGWFGFLTQDERRAPGWLQRAGLEWSYRLAQAPRRLAGRYALGALTTARLAGPQLRSRTAPPTASTARPLRGGRR